MQYLKYIKYLALVSAAWATLSAAAYVGQPMPVQVAKAERLSSADREKIRRVILLQIRAFERMDDTVAFSYATPETRRYFGTPRAFMEMVRADYTALFKNVSREFLEAAVIDGTVVQPLRIVTHEGETLVALYTVQRQADREWRIGGCELAPSTVQSI